MDELRRALEKGFLDLLGIHGDEPWLEGGALFREPLGGSTMLPIELNLPPLGAGPLNLDDLLKLIGREDFKNGHPQEGLDLTSTIYLTRLAILFGDSLAESDVFLGLSWPMAQWNFLETPHLDLHAPQLVVGFSKNSFEGRLSGTVGIGEFDLNFSVEYPALVATGQLATSSSDIHSIKPLLEHFGVKHSPIDSLKLSEARFLVDKKNDKLEMQCELTDVLNIDIGPFGEFSIETLSFDLTRVGSGNRMTAWNVCGKALWEFAYGEKEQQRVNLHLSATYSHESIKINGVNNPAENKGGWQLEGGTEIGQEIPVGKLVERLAHEFKINDHTFPAALSGLKFKNLRVSLDSNTNTFEFGGEIQLPIGGTELEATVSITIEPESNPEEEPNAKVTYRKEFRGYITIGHRQFDICFAKDHRSSNVVASYAAEGDTLHLKEDLLAHFVENADLIKDIPDLEVTLKNVFFAKMKAADSSSKIIAVTLDAKLPVPKLPLIGEVLFGVEDLQAIYATNEITGKVIEPLNAMLPEHLTRLPSPHESTTDGEGSDQKPTDEAIALNKGFNLVAKLTLGGETLNLSTVGPRSAVGKPTQKKSAKALRAANREIKTTHKNSSVVESEAPAPSTSTSPDPVPSGNAQWMSIQKAVGPLYFDKVGVRYEAGELWLLLNANLTMGGLTLILDGLALSSPLDTFDPSFHLHGLGLDYNKPPLEIGGMFARFDENGQEEYAGLVVVKTESLSLSALGAYTKDEKGHPSMFIYMTLEEPLGGPPFFFVTGLAGGIGFNRALKVPPVEKLGEFPFVVQAMSASPVSIPDSGGPAAMASSLGEQLNAVKEFVPPEAGQFWLAAGVKFTSFEIVDGFVLLTVSFGHRFEMRLLGEGTYAYPPGSKETGTSLTKIKVDIEASYLPAEGLIEMSAQIAEGSYLYHPDCHLTGGIAFRSWFAGPREDEFVLTIGGYHPKFKVPKDYPTAPRLGFNWQYSDALSVKGGAYFAMTGHVLMAGGFLDANWNSGCLRAWFKASADFLVRYKPFHYDIDISVEIGASVTIHFFGTHHLTVSLGAALHLEGPDFSGTAHLHIWIASFTIHFGGTPAGPKVLPWHEFRGSFLPKNDDDIIGVSVKSGLVKTLKGQKLKQDSWEFEQIEQATHWVMNAPEFALAMHSMIPINKWILPESEDVITGTPFGIAPMNLRIENEGITSKITLTVKHDGEGDVTKDFVIEPVRRSVPAGLWGDEFLPDVNSESVVKDVVTGFRIGAGPKRPPEKTHDIPCKNLAFDTDLFKGAYTWEGGWDEFMPKGLMLAESIATSNRLEVRNSLLTSFDLPADIQLQEWSGMADESELLAMPISIPQNR